jgi:hypothetical protein
MDLDGPVPGIPGASMRRVASLPDFLPNGEPAGPHAQAEPGQLLLVVPGVGRFLARDGTTIEFAVEGDADPGMVALLLHGSARGALIHQRGEFPLHAATLVPPGGDRGVAICGSSGAGKSTLAAELSRRGWALVADDTTRLTWTGSEAMAWPSRDSIKLWRDACEAAGIEIRRLERVCASLDKHYLQVPAHNKPVKLVSVFELTTKDVVDPVPASAGEKMALLSRHTFRPEQIRPLGRTADYVRIVARVAESCRLSHLAGARTRSVGALADAVEETMS